MSQPPIVRTRFAPSPSGHLHVGGARTALFCWAYARKHGGKFILRIEDTDQKRSHDIAKLAFLEDLKWLGIEWDEGPVFQGCGGGDAGPYFQSQRLDLYHKYIEQLLEEGKAYRAFETTEELDVARKQAREGKKNYRYDRAALDTDADTREKWADEGKPHVVRFRVPDEGTNTVHDEVRGDVTIDATELDDFVIQKADGYPTYHFAVVVDDELMGVTHVIRAEEHLKNTHKHILLQEALGFRQPVFAHISVITNPDGSKMSKRDKDKALRKAYRVFVESNREKSVAGDEAFNAAIARWQEDRDCQLDWLDAEDLALSVGCHLPEINVDDFRRAGYLPEALINYLALLGWNPGGDLEKFTSDFLCKNFDFDRVQKSPAKFDREKLRAFNHDAIQALPADEFVRIYRNYWQTYFSGLYDLFTQRRGGHVFDILARANQARSKTLSDTINESYFFLEADDKIQYEKTKAVRKALVNGEPCGYDHLEAIIPELRKLLEWTVETIEKALKSYAETHADGKLGKVAQPIRIAVSGGTISPAIFDTLFILGRESVINRIERCLAHRNANV
ncbi:MAG: glutamate--tRNA ligase [Planctomycetes bacterium]|nr:glutamate--tRNA ligase [Planctomycetota bacterium]